MTLNQLNDLDEQEIAMALYIVNHISPPAAPKVEFNPRDLTWFRHDMLIQKFINAFPQVLPESHPIFTSLLQKLGVVITIKKVEPVVPAPVSTPDLNAPISASAPTTSSL